MTAASLPDDPFSITAEWLADVLDPSVLGGGRLTGVEISDIGSGTGIFGELGRLSLTVEGGDGSAPPSLVAKMACTEPANLAVAQALGIYDRELTFFDEIAPSTSLRVPECHLALRSDDGRFVLILEDMSLQYDVGDQVVGATVAQAEAIVDELAVFHARWWEDPALASMDWLPYPDDPAYVAAVPGIYSTGLPVLESEWADRVAPESIALARRLEPQFLDLLYRTATGPVTFIHTDTRLDNIFFAKDGSGDVAFIDFQLALRGRGAADIAYLIGTSVPTADAAANWEALLRRWHEALAASGVDYAWADCLRHYREAALYYLSGAMSLIGSFDTGNDRGAAMAEAYSTRILQHVIDIEAGQVLD